MSLLSELFGFKQVAGCFKLVGAVLFTLALVPVAAFSSLLIGSTLSALVASRNGERLGSTVDAAFMVASTTHIFRALLG
jgi:hypothetical protein